MTNYYNEFDPDVALVLRGLIADGLIPYGHVDTRSIEHVQPDDLRGFTQHHFFAGIGGWAEALRIAGVPSSQRIWTGSCPCQPFSQTGTGTGFDDERHLWPAFQWLIQQCGPELVVGEQVASPDAKPWLDLVCDDMEAMGYAFGACVLPACAIGSPQQRERTFWVGDRNIARLEGLRNRHQAAPGQWENAIRSAAQAGAFGHWDTATWVACRDGKERPLEPGLQPLAYGIPNRVVALHGFGNAIVPQVGAAFLSTFLK